MPSSYSYSSIILVLSPIFIFLSLVPHADALSCLVIRPGYGLVSEQCPSSAIGCRIRVAGDHIEWYEWARLYDRNQLVCVYPEEYQSISGCQRKASGSVRCWCGGMDDCNDAPTSKALYEAFTGKDTLKMNEIARRLESGLSYDVPATDEATTTTRATTTTSKMRKETARKQHHIKKVTIQTRRPPLALTLPVTTTTTEKAYTLPTSPTTTTSTSTKPPTTIKATDMVVTRYEDAMARPLPTESNPEMDGLFEETRRKLAAEMREEDERLQQLLRDEESEMLLDRDAEEEDEMEKGEMEKREQELKRAQTNSEQGRIERKERARAEERRRQAEEERLARIEREEASQKEKVRRLTASDDSTEDDDYEYEGFGFTATSTAFSSIFALLVTIIVNRLLL